ncbi:MAG: selenide, water dikinase SelD [Pseudomonadota bacterium]
MQTRSAIPISRDLVLLGGGHTHALVLLKWAMQPLAGVQVTLVNPDVKAPYTGMLPGFVAGHYTRDELDIDLVKLARQAGAKLIVDRAVGIDVQNRRVHLSNRPDIAYDTLSIDIGIGSPVGTGNSDEAKIIPAKPLGPFADQWALLLSRIRDSGFEPHISVIGGGVAGVELALAMAHRLKRLQAHTAQIEILESGPTILRGLNSSTRGTLLRALAAANICIRTDHDALTNPPEADFIVSAAGASPHTWLQQTDLELDAGYIRVDRYLRSETVPDVFAVGDCAHLSHAPRPKAGVFAVRQAPVLFENLRAHLSGRPLKRFTPQRSYLKLISLGGKSAVTDKWKVGLAGSWVWRWKDRIDRAFMRKFEPRAAMAEPDLPVDRALGVEELLQQQKHACGACGAKVAQGTLAQGLLQTGDHSAVPEDAAIVEAEGRFDLFSTDHLRAFNQDPYILAKVAAVHALGDIWAMGADPKTALAQIILPPLAHSKQAEMIAEIMSGANQIFRASGLEIGGGHTSNGAELTVGFAVSGTADRAPIRLSGAKTEDVLVLTKPLGTGVILAAEMRQLADGKDYQAAIESMCHAQFQASRRLRKYATSMTDVTGFGLAGHLLNILSASNVSASLNLAHIPTLCGATALSAASIRSTLWPENMAHCRDFIDFDVERYSLLFDPQTSGGLLATIPSDALSQVVADFESDGEPIWKIGEILTGAPQITTRSVT